MCRQEIKNSYTSASWDSYTNTQVSEQESEALLIPHMGHGQMVVIPQCPQYQSRASTGLSFVLMILEPGAFTEGI